MSITETESPQPSANRATVKITILLFAVIAVALAHLRFISDSNALNDLPVPFWVKGFVYVNTFISYFLLLVLALRSKFVAYFLLPACVILQMAAYYIASRYGICPASELVTAALETNWQEISGFLYPSHYVLIPLALVLLLGGICLLRHKLSNFPQMATWKVWVAAGLYIGISSLAFPLGVRFFPETTSHLIASLECNISPDSPLYRSTVVERMQVESSPEYIYRIHVPFYRQMSTLYNIYLYYKVSSLKKADQYPSHEVFSDPDLTVVLVIGESFRSDHSPWNGYPRNTLPQLTNTARTNIINFPWFKSYATTTITSIYGMLSDATCTKRQATYTSFLGILKNHGFDTQLLVSRSGVWYKNPQIHSLIRDQLDGVTTSKSNDEIGRHFLHACSRPGRKFIIVEDGIGHYPYRHEEEFTHFDESDPDNRINRYDNCLLQTDDLLARLITTLKDRNAVLIFSSDHGQSFGEQGVWMHGGLLGVEKQRHIFSFVWCSDVYRQRHPEIVANMQANHRKPLSHDDLYHSILSLCGIESAIQNPALDFTKPLDRPDVSAFTLEDER